MIGRGDDYKGVIAHRGGLQGHIARGAAHDHQINLSVADAFDGFGAVAHQKADLDPRMAAAKRRDHRRREIFGGGNRAQPHPPALARHQRGDLVL